MTATETLAQYQAIAGHATQGPWAWDGRQVPTLHGVGGDESFSYSKEVIETTHDGGCGCRKYCEQELLVSQLDAEFIAVSRTLAPAMAAALQEIMTLHRPGYWSYPIRSGRSWDDECEVCLGKSGVHECGCWADEDRAPQCRECSKEVGADKPWPCPTLRSITKHLEGPRILPPGS